MDLSESFISTLENWMKAFMRRSMRDSVVFAKQNGLSMTQIAALLQISQKGCSNVTCIGDELGITNPAASQLLDRLVQQELVVRSEDPNDRRSKQFAMTEKGLAVLRGGFHARKKWMEDLVHLMSAGEQAQVIAALQIMLEKESLLAAQAASGGSEG